MLGKTFKNKYKVAFTENGMTWTDEKGTVKRFKRLS